MSDTYWTLVPEPAVRAILELIEPYVTGNAATNDHTKRQIAQQVERELALQPEWGGIPLDDVRAALDADGLVRFVEQLQREAKAEVFVNARGAWVSVPRMVSIPVRVSNGSVHTAHQLKLWADLTWDEFDKLIARTVIQEDLIGTQRAAYECIATLHERFPDAPTIRDACMRAGIDPDHFLLP